MNSPRIQDEIDAQNALLNAVFRRSDVVQTMCSSLGQTPESAASPAATGSASMACEGGVVSVGLQAYRNSGALNAIRAVSLLFPAVHAVLGEDDFASLARLYWLACPPQCGDWSQYGGDFGDWMAQHNPGAVLDALPFLPDLARFDNALASCQDAANATPDLGTLALLEQDPATVTLVLHPSVSILHSAYDLCAYRIAVLGAAAMTEPTAHAESIPARGSSHPAHPMRQASNIVVARHGWRAVGTPCSAADAAFVRNTQLGSTVIQAHDAACALDANFDASQWLTQAIGAHWLLGARLTAPIKPTF